MTTSTLHDVMRGCMWNVHDAGGPLDAVCARFAEMHLLSVLAEADAVIVSKRSEKIASSGNVMDTHRDSVSRDAAHGCSESHDDSEEEGLVLQALRRYRAAAWW